MRIFAVFILLGACCLPAPAQSRLSSDDIAQLHWLKETAAEARLRTQAAEQWLLDPQANADTWREQIQLRVLALKSRNLSPHPTRYALLDGMLGWLVHARARLLNQPGGDNLLAESFLKGSAMPAGEAVLRAEEVWTQLRARLAGQEHAAPELSISEFWADVSTLAEGATPQARAHAAAQAQKAAGLPTLEGTQRLAALAVMARDSAEFSWMQDQILPAVWHLMDALAIQLFVGQAEEFDALDRLLEQMANAEAGRLQAVDADLPLILVRLTDVLLYARAEPVQADQAIEELTDAYFQLTFGVADAAFYLDQPVRDRLTDLVADCLPDPLLVGPLPVGSIQECPERLVAALNDALDSEELVGGTGPFAPEFLRREADLLSWQRWRYLDGHLNWQLQASCEPPVRSNPLEWSILAEALSSWITQRPIVFQTERWQSSFAEMIETIESQASAQRAWLDCVAGQGGQRVDPVTRLFALHNRALRNLDLALESAYEDFLSSQTRPGSDVNLSAGVEQQTAYRPEGLEISPCAESLTCGARATLPVSRALLGLFPNTYLLADQLGMGRLALCYENVRWVDREMRLARPDDDRVSNYFGRLSFELVGQFQADDGGETVFRQRLTANEAEHYLFAAADDVLLEQDCPDGMAGRPVASHLPADRLGLVPDRLTYFAATPVTANALLAANWEQGAEWRDWFITPDRTEVLEAPGATALQVRVQNALDELSMRRERSVADRLLGEPEADALAVALAAVVDSRILIRRMVEIHYPRLHRHDQMIRSSLTGMNGLVGREQIRRFIEIGRSLSMLAEDGLAQLARLKSEWEDLPVVLREQGQPSPEAEHAARVLSRLRSFSSASVAVESSPDP